MIKNRMKYYNLFSVFKTVNSYGQKVDDVRFNRRIKVSIFQNKEQDMEQDVRHVFRYYTGLTYLNEKLEKNMILEGLDDIKFKIVDINISNMYQVLELEKYNG